MSVRIRWIALVTVAALGALLAIPAVANAAGPKLKLVPAVGPPTAAVHAKGSQYPPGHGEIVTFDGVQVATALSSPSGTFTAKFTVPSSGLPGTHTVTAADANGLGASATFLVRTDWSNARFDPAGSGFNPFENVLNPSNASQLSQLVDAELGATMHSEPIYTGGTLVAGLDDGTVRALDPHNGQQMWSFATGGPVMGSPLTVYKKTTERCAIVAGSQDGSLYGIDPIRGTQVWSASLGAPISTSPVALVPVVQKVDPGVVPTPTAVEDVVAVADDGSVYALNGCTGAPVWSRPPDPTRGSPTSPAILPGVLVGGTTHTIIVVGSSGNGIEALDAPTGTSLWSYSEMPPGPNNSPSGYGSGTAARIVYGSGSSIVELNGAGTPVWTHDTGGTVEAGVGLFYQASTAALKLSVRGIIAGNDAGNVFDLAPGTGRQLWSMSLGAPVHSSPAIDNGVIYLITQPLPGGGGKIVAANALSGTKIFQGDLGALNPLQLPPMPSFADGMVFTGSFDTEMRVFALPA